MTTKKEQPPTPEQEAAMDDHLKRLEAEGDDRKAAGGRKGADRHLADMLLAKHQKAIDEARRGKPRVRASEIAAALRGDEDFRDLEGRANSLGLCLSRIKEEAAMNFIAHHFGDGGGVMAFMKEAKVVGRVFYWSERHGQWDSMTFGDGSQSLMSLIYFHPRFGYLHAVEQMGQRYCGYPRADAIDRDFAQIAGIIKAYCGKDEEVAAAFDRLRVNDYATGERSRFLFGERKVCEIWREGGQWNFRDGVQNRRRFMLRKDFAEGGKSRVADDAEFAANRARLIELLSAYCEDYGMDADAKAVSPLVKSGADCSTGNAWLDDFFLSQAGMFAPVPLRPLTCCIGTAGAGKSALFRILNACYGDQIMRIDLDKETFTGGDSLPRLREHRAKLPQTRSGVSMDLATNASLDSGFVKSLCANEGVSFGGMYKSDITRPLEFTGYFSSNEMPRLIDSSEGTTDRLWHLPFKKKYRGVEGVEKTHEELLEEFQPLFPTLRRLLLEFVKALVLNLKCKMPAQHPMLLEAKKTSIEDAEFPLKTYARNFFRLVTDEEAEDADCFAYNYRQSRQAEFCIPIGQSTRDRLNGYCFVEDEEGRPDPRAGSWTGFRALAAQWEHAHKSGMDSKVVQQRTLSRLLREGQGWHFDQALSAFTGRVHTTELVAYLYEGLGNRNLVLKFLKALYRGPHRRGAEVADALLLTEEMEKVFRGQGGGFGDDGEEPVI